MRAPFPTVDDLEEWPELWGDNHRPVLAVGALPREVWEAVARAVLDAYGDEPIYAGHAFKSPGYRRWTIAIFYPCSGTERDGCILPDGVEGPHRHAALFGVDRDLEAVCYAD